jgi:hypothetical protein
MPNRWVEHVRAFAAKNKMSYMCAMSDPDIKKGYIPTEKKKQKTEKLEQAMPSTEPTPKNIVIKPRPEPAPAQSKTKVVIAIFKENYLRSVFAPGKRNAEELIKDTKKWAITDGGEILELKDATPFNRENRVRVATTKGEGEDRTQRIRDAFNKLEGFGDFTMKNGTKNLLKYTKKDEDDLKRIYGLSMAIPSQEVLKHFYSPKYLKRKGAVLPDFVTNP